MAALLDPVIAISAGHRIGQFGGFVWIARPGADFDEAAVSWLSDIESLPEHIKGVLTVSALLVADHRVVRFRLLMTAKSTTFVCDRFEFGLHPIRIKALIASR